MATPIDASRRPLIVGLVAVLLMALLSGCGQPQVARDHRDLVLRLATGASTRDRGILDRAGAEVDRLEAAGELAADETKAFRGILGAAGSGDWDRAQSLAYALRDGQEPTVDDRQRIASRPLPGMKKPETGRPGRPGR